MTQNGLQALVSAISFSLAFLTAVGSYAVPPAEMVEPEIHEPEHTSIQNCRQGSRWFVRFQLMSEVLCIEREQVVSYERRDHAVLNVQLPVGEQKVGTMVIVRPRLEWDLGWAMVEDLGEAKELHDYRSELQLVHSTLIGKSTHGGFRQSVMPTEDIKKLAGLYRASRTRFRGERLQILWDDGSADETEGLAICQNGADHDLSGGHQCLYVLLTQSFIIEVALPYRQLKSENLRIRLQEFVTERLVARSTLVSSFQGTPRHFALTMAGVEVTVPYKYLETYEKYGTHGPSFSFSGIIVDDEVFLFASNPVPVSQPLRRGIELLGSLGEVPTMSGEMTISDRIELRRKCRHSDVQLGGEPTSYCQANFLLAPGLMVTYSYRSKVDSEPTHIDQSIREFLEEFILASQ